MAGTVAVVTDSASSIPGDTARAWGIAVVPLEVRIGERVYLEGGDLTAEDVVEALRGGETVTTSQPSVGAFAEAYRAAVDAGASAIVSVHISSKASGTVNAARIAAAESPVPVEIVDSRTFGMATGWAALAGAAVARDGGALADVVERATRTAASSSIFIAVDTLRYLKRGGRVSPAVANLGDALGIRPVLGARDGEIVLLARVRATARARAAIVDMAEEAIALTPSPGLAAMALRDSEFADDVLAIVGKRNPGLRKVVRAPLSAALAVHGGPGVLAVVVADLPSALL